jgi:hypothetical protein
MTTDHDITGIVASYRGPYQIITLHTPEQGCLCRGCSVRARGIEELMFVAKVNGVPAGVGTHVRLRWVKGDQYGGRAGEAI